MTCGRVVIINQGRVVAEDTPANLTHRLRGAGAFRVEVRGEPAAVAAALGAVPGVIAVQPVTGEAGSHAFEVETESGRDPRAEVARALVGQGFDLLSLHQVGMSLEEIFLHLTTTEVVASSSSGAEPTEVDA
jgi:ABC-2 type transport system ATP-binding protein